ncbi:hypothetical protein [Caldimonas tepidiphila]|uniref:hypothetical protein n=1 Tax=Caldimonas tepidiphila TaxID=2315841 RepID=UPI000E5ADC62|nr:hypothetical protein [Caldimonas tepidiphila]
MSDAAAFMLTAFCMAVLFGVWHFLFERIPLESLGRERVQRVLEQVSPARRERILSRGWTTRDEWMTINIRRCWREGAGTAASADRDEA